MIYDLLLDVSGERNRDVYLLNPDAFNEGYFIVLFDLTAVQDGGESSTPFLCKLANIRLTFSIGNPILPVLFFCDKDESLIQVDNHGTVQSPIPSGDM